MIFGIEEGGDMDWAGRIRPMRVVIHSMNGSNPSDIGVRDSRWCAVGAVFSASRDGRRTTWMCKLREEQLEWVPDCTEGKGESAEEEAQEGLRESSYASNLC